MQTSSPPLQLDRLASANGSPSWRRKALWILGALAVHLAPIAMLLGALAPKPNDLGGAFGSSVSITLVSSAPSSTSAASASTSAAQPALARMEQRLTDQTVDPAATSHTPTQARTTRLSDLFSSEGAGPAQTAAKGPPSPLMGGDDDPFARASVSYRGDDPAKAARLQAKARNCSRATQSTRLLVIINSEGYLVARPRLLGAKPEDKSVAKVIAALAGCGPFTDAATPGPPRSYEIDVG